MLTYAITYDYTKIYSLIIILYSVDMSPNPSLNFRGTKFQITSPFEILIFTFV